MKLKTVLILLFLIFTALVIIYIDRSIKNYDLRFYSGKDDGYILRLESIVCLNTVHYILNIIQPKVKLGEYLTFASIGFVTAILISIICYLIIPSDDEGTLFHIVSITLCYSLIYVFRRLKQIIEKKTSAK